MKRFSAGLFALLSLGFVLGACSKSKQLQDKIADSIKSETGVDAKVSCPSGVDAKKGEKLTCTATGNFTPYLESVASSNGRDISGASVNSIKINVEFTDDNTFSAAPDTDDVESQIAAQLGNTNVAPATDTTASDSGTDATLPGGDDEN